MTDQPVTPDREALIEAAAQAIWEEAPVSPSGFRLSRADARVIAERQGSRWWPLITDALDRARQQGRDEVQAIFDRMWADPDWDRMTMSRRTQPATAALGCRDGSTTDRRTPMSYPTEVLDEDEDDGTMPANVGALADAVVGHRIVSVERNVHVPGGWSGGTTIGTRITLDNGKRVNLVAGGDCCAYTELEAFLLHPERVDHVITGVGTTDGYTTWHVYADAGDVLELTVGWSAGNPFYYAYGFDIVVSDD